MSSEESSIEEDMEDIEDDEDDDIEHVEFTEIMDQNFITQNVLTTLFGDLIRGADPSAPPVSNVIDALTGSNTSRATVSLSNGKIYDAALLAEYLLYSKDHRDPASGSMFTPEDLKVIASVLEPIDLDTSSRIKNSAAAEDLPSAPTTSAVKYFEDTIALTEIQLLAACELTSINNLFELQSYSDSTWAIFIRCFSGLISFNPLAATRAASKLQLAFTEAAASSESLDSYVYEQSVILPIATSIHALCTSVGMGILRNSTKDCLKQIRGVRLARFVF